MSESMRTLSALADLSVAGLTTLTPLQTLHAVEHLEAATAGLDALRRNLDAALDATYGERIRRACAEAGQVAGLVHIDAFALTRELYLDWKDWADLDGEFVGSIKRFSADLSARGYLQKRNGTGQRGFVGLRVLPRPNAYAQAVAGLDTASH